MIPANLIHDSFNVPSLRGMGNLGLFETPSDISTWGFGEWAVALGVAYVGIKLIGDVGRVGSSVRRASRKRSSRAKKRKRLEEELAGL